MKERIRKACIGVCAVVAAWGTLTVARDFTHGNLAEKMRKEFERVGQNVTSTIEVAKAVGELWDTLSKLTDKRPSDADIQRTMIEARKTADQQFKGEQLNP